MATRLYQNNARVHFNQHVSKKMVGLGKRIIYGGYIISLARAISCNGLSNTIKLATEITQVNIRLQRLVVTQFIFIKEILEKYNNDVGIMRIRTLASKNCNKNYLSR